MLTGFNVEWLYDCYDNWTRSGVQTGAWRYHNNFDGFVRWFLQVEMNYPGREGHVLRGDYDYTR